MLNYQQAIKRLMKIPGVTDVSIQRSVWHKYEDNNGYNGFLFAGLKIVAHTADITPHPQSLEQVVVALENRMAGRNPE
jgi:hypothetical protein